jgi:hypothetical protein
MGTLLRGARVFSNETANNASVKEEMNTNINVRLKPTQQNNQQANNQPPPAYPSPPSYPSIAPEYNPRENINFTQPFTDDPPPELLDRPLLNQNTTPIMAQSRYPSPAFNPHPPVERSVNIENTGELENKIKVLEALLAIYEGAPVIIKGCLIVSQKKLIEIVQILTGADDVELLTEDVDLGCCGSSKVGFVCVSKIFVVFGKDRTEFKVSHNAEYSLLLRHGLNLKLIRIE